MYLEDEFDNFCGRKCKKAREEKASEEGRLRDIAKYTNSTYAIIPEFYGSLNYLASSLSKYSEKQIANFRVELNKLYSKMGSNSFRGNTPNADVYKTRLEGKKIKTFIDERTPIFRSYEDKLKSEKERVTEKEATRKQLFTDIAVNYDWAVNPINSTILSKISDVELEDSLIALEEYILYESDSNILSTFQSRINKIIAEQKTRVNDEQDEAIYKDESVSNSDEVDLSLNEPKSTLQNTLLKNKYYIGGALVFAIVGIIVIRKI